LKDIDFENSNFKGLILPWDVGLDFLSDVSDRVFFQSKNPIKRRLWIKTAPGRDPARLCIVPLYFIF
jgi:hypothetical protein